MWKASLEDVRKPWSHKRCEHCNHITSTYHKFFKSEKLCNKCWGILFETFECLVEHPFYPEFYDEEIEKLTKEFEEREYEKS